MHYIGNEKLVIVGISFLTSFFGNTIYLTKQSEFEKCSQKEERKQWKNSNRSNEKSMEMVMGVGKNI